MKRILSSLSENNLQCHWTFILLAALLFLVPQRLRAAETADTNKVFYTCSMDRQVIQDHPGPCPICGMKLQPIRKDAVTVSAAARKIKSYRSTMMPGELSPTPAKDSMGMDMVPVYEDAASNGGGQTIAVDAVTIQNMNIRTAPVNSGPLRRIIRTVGTIEYNETALAEVSTKFKGWIEQLHVDATGQLVHRGEPMFDIFSPELYSAEEEYVLALKITSTNDADVKLMRNTAANKLKFYDISDEQIAELEKTRTIRKTMSILAPMDGVVTEKLVVRGRMVDTGQTLYRLADLGIVWVFAQIYEQDLPLVKLGQEAVVKVASLPDREFRGRVTFVYPTVDEKTRTARVRMEFENPGYFLKPGMFVSVEVAADTETPVVLVPDSAVLRSGVKNTAFVALGGGKFEARTVVLGAESGNGLYQVLSGLNDGERVVTSGQFMLDSESQLREAIEKMNSPAGNTPVVVAASGTNLMPAMPMQGSAASPVVYVCPMPEHVAIVYDHPGKCPICAMSLVPVSPGELKQVQPGGNVLYYTCPMPEHASVHEHNPGKCPLCAMTLIPVMASPVVSTNSPK